MSPLTAATTQVAASSGDSTSRYYDRRLGPPVLTGPAVGFVGLLMGLGFSVKWAWVGFKGFGLVLGFGLGFKWALSGVRIWD